MLDPLLIRADRPAFSAVLTLTLPSHPASAACEILVAGASTGGVAAALAAAESGHTVCLTEETNWIGGQLTAQGVSAVDGNRYVETTGVTASFQRLRRAIRGYYKAHYQLSSLGAGEKFFNPGNCWVSALCFQAPVALQVIDTMLRPLESKGLLKIFLRSKVVRVEKRGNRIDSVLAYEFNDRKWVRFKPRYVIDATDTGELLPLAAAEYVTGAEPRSRTDEPDARAGSGDPHDSQSFTYTFVLARKPGHNHTIPPPIEYELHRVAQPYTLTLNYGGGKLLTYRMFQKAPGTPGSFWDYRRLIAGTNFRGPGAPREISMVNWPGNDYCGPGLLSDDPLKQARALLEAKKVALGFAYWLQTAAPRDDGSGMGYPGLELLTGALGSQDGLSQFPYIRESRRIVALKTIREQDISSIYQKGPRAARFADSVGIGFYAIDIHGCSAEDFASGAKPFQIPLGALIPKDVVNLLAASKDVGTTHITNGAYRLHPVEWAVGEAAGTLAAFALDRGVTPAKIDVIPGLVAELQRKLLIRGAPVFWFDDLPPQSTAFAAAQFLAVRGIFGPNSRDLHFNPRQPVSRAEAAEALRRAGLSPGTSADSLPQGAVMTRAQFAIWLAARLGE
ncbi:MAG: FAD-dependent oxidoreductase [Terriglobia bacterium]